MPNAAGDKIKKINKMSPLNLAVWRTLVALRKIVSSQC